MRAVLFAVGWLFIIIFGLPLAVAFLGGSLYEAWYLYVIGILVGVGLLMWRSRLPERDQLL